MANQPPLRCNAMQYIFMIMYNRQRTSSGAGEEGGCYQEVSDMVVSLLCELSLKEAETSNHKSKLKQK